METRNAVLAGLVAAAVVVVASSALAAPPVTPVAGPLRPPPTEHPPAEAAVFLQRVLAQIVRNDYARAWLTLHPAQREAVPQASYVRCELASPIAARLVWIRAQRVAPRQIVVPGSSTEPVPAQAVTFRLRLKEGRPPSSTVVTQTVHTVAVDGRWTWMLPPDRFELHRSGTCVRRA